MSDSKLIIGLKANINKQVADKKFWMRSFHDSCGVLLNSWKMSYEAGVRAPLREIIWGFVEKNEVIKNVPNSVIGFKFRRNDWNIVINRKEFVMNLDKLRTATQIAELFIPLYPEIREAILKRIEAAESAKKPELKQEPEPETESETEDDEDVPITTLIQQLRIENKLLDLCLNSIHDEDEEEENTPIATLIKQRKIENKLLNWLEPEPRVIHTGVKKVIKIIRKPDVISLCSMFSD